jgi:hypothetical protein
MQKSRKTTDDDFLALGQFVVTFQRIECKYREIGWMILDPEKREWPPMQLRSESNRDLINKVTDLYVDLTNQYEFPNGVLVAKDMRLLQEKFHELRRYRNRLLHSAYEPLKAGDEILGYLRIDPIVAVEKETGNVIHEVEPLSSDAI